MLEIVFFTSSRIKLAHARYLCRNYAVRISDFREKTYGASYHEPRLKDRSLLLEVSYRNALERWKKAYPRGENKLFFIEDTSVVIEALSAEQETPGLDVKYWMAETDFATLDAQLKKYGNNRRATVRSDLILHIPPNLRSRCGDNEYLHFTSMAHGSVVENELVINTNPMYPWLDNRTFNKWFVPEGCSQSISLLPIEEADKYDFRAPAFREMLAFLEGHQKISRRAEPVQASFDFDSYLFIVCGPSCAGKTTLAEYLADHYGYYHIEASDFMYMSYYQRHGVPDVINIGDFAKQALLEQPEIVAAKILINIQLNKSVPVIITGFRSPAELDWFYKYYTGKYSIEAVYVTADEGIRYFRSLTRQREGEAEDMEVFVRRDAEQAAMGLVDMEKRLESNYIENNGSLQEYFTSFEARYIQKPRQTLSEDKARVSASSGKLEKSILLVLAEHRQSQKYFTTTEIAQLINQSLEDKPKKSKNNVSRYFNQTFYPYYEIKLIGGKKKYRLSNTGYGKARILGVTRK